MLGVGHVEPSISGVNQFQPQLIPLTGLESLWPWFLGSLASPNLKRIVLSGFYPKDTIWIIIPNKVENDKMMYVHVCTVVNPGPLCFHGFHHINLFNWCLRLGCFRPPLSNAMGMLPPQTPWALSMRAQFGDFGRPECVLFRMAQVKSTWRQRDAQILGVPNRAYGTDTPAMANPHLVAARTPCWIRWRAALAQKVYKCCSWCK